VFFPRDGYLHQSPIGHGYLHQSRTSYFCGGLQVYMADGEAATPTMIIAGVGDKMRTSPILMP
jgi:hypothetical protein